MTLILTKSKVELALGRFRLMINEISKVVQIRWVAGDSPSREELKCIDKFLSFSRPDIMNQTLRTGWAIECMSAPIATSFRANSKNPR